MSGNTKRVGRRQHVRLNVYAVIDRAVDEGLAYAVRRVDKYSPTPLTDGQRGALLDQGHQAVMNALCEVLAFDD